jgi:hypothetical protein
MSTMLTGLHTLGGVEILGTIEKLKPDHVNEQTVQVARAKLMRARQTLVAAPRVSDKLTAGSPPAD